MVPGMWVVAQHRDCPVMTALTSPTMGTSAWRSADLGRVDVGVADLASGAKESSFAGHPVVEAGYQRDQQVAALAAPPRRPLCRACRQRRTKNETKTRCA